MFHELNHVATSDAFNALYAKEVSSDDFFYLGPHSAPQEVVTEYLANDWTGHTSESVYDDHYQRGYKQLDDAVIKLGNGDRNAGMEILKRAYYAGDPRALKQLMAVFPPKKAADYTYPGHQAQPSTQA